MFNQYIQYILNLNQDKKNANKAFSKTFRYKTLYV